MLKKKEKEIHLRKNTKNSKSRLITGEEQQLRALRVQGEEKDIIYSQSLGLWSNIALCGVTGVGWNLRKC